MGIAAVTNPEDFPVAGQDAGGTIGDRAARIWRLLYSKHRPNYPAPHMTQVDRKHLKDLVAWMGETAVEGLEQLGQMAEVFIRDFTLIKKHLKLRDMAPKIRTLMYFRDDIAAIVAEGGIIDRSERNVKQPGEGGLGW